MIDDILLGFALGLGIAVIGLALAAWVARSGALFDDEGNLL